MKKIQCYRCGHSKQEDAFPVNNQMRRGRDSWCFACRREYSAWYASQNRDYFRNYARTHPRPRKGRKKVFSLSSIMARYKRMKGCLNCGEKFPRALDWHHVDPASKEFNIGMNVRKYARDRIAREIEKCVLLCKTCHVKVHRGVLRISPNQPFRILV